MNLRQLEVLRAVVRYGTTVATGQALGLSQPSISNAIKTMEDQVGFALFQRLNNRIYPTEEAKILLRDAESIFETHELLESKINDLRNNRAGRLRIVATPPLGHGHVARAISTMQVKRPRVRPSIEIKRDKEVIQNIETNQSEIGFMIGFKDRAGIRSEVLYRGEMVCVMPPHHPLTAREFVDPQALQKHRFIALDGASHLGKALRQAFDDAPEVLSSAVEVSYGLTGCVLVEAGVGVAVVDPITASTSGQFSLVTRPFFPKIPVEACVLWAENQSLSRIASFFIQEVRSLISHTSLRQ
jgi:DNA-binding transcriptional LysR family regulator